jgi:hypothetical protein
MDFRQQLLEYLARVVPYAFGGGFVLVTNSWRLSRQNRYLRELLRRQKLESDEQLKQSEQRSVERQNETLRIVCTAYASGEPLTLADLLSKADRDWSLRSSATR